MSTTDTTPERCPVCDAVLATEADSIFSSAPLCWSLRYPVDGHFGPPVDWRARALAAEAERDELADQLAEANSLAGINSALTRLSGEHEFTPAGAPLREALRALWRARQAGAK